MASAYWICSKRTENIPSLILTRCLYVYVKHIQYKMFFNPHSWLGVLAPTSLPKPHCHRGENSNGKGLGCEIWSSREFISERGCRLQKRPPAFQYLHFIQLPSQRNLSVYCENHVTYVRLWEHEVKHYTLAYFKCLNIHLWIIGVSTC